MFAAKILIRVIAEFVNASVIAPDSLVDIYDKLLGAALDEQTPQVRQLCPPSNAARRRARTPM